MNGRTEYQYGEYSLLTRDKNPGFNPVVRSDEIRKTRSSAVAERPRVADYFANSLKVIRNDTLK